jgi:putative zinc finger/helix-turn-helix YgiT family protein
MNCITCGENAIEVLERKQASYRGEKVEVSRAIYRCESCQDEFATPEQARAYVRAVKNEVRKKYGLLSPERVAAIRGKLGLTQMEVEKLLNTGPKVVVRWESGKVIQSVGHDNMLRLLERNPSTLEFLRQVQQLRAEEQRTYASSQTNPASVGDARTG